MVSEQENREQANEKGMVEDGAVQATAIDPSANGDTSKKLTKKEKQAAEFQWLPIPADKMPDSGIIEVPLSTLTALENTPIKNARYAMREINKEHVDHLLRAYERGDMLPALDVVTSSAGVVVVDGNHRWAAIEQLVAANTKPEALAAARKEIKVRVHPLQYTKNHDVIQAAFTANLTNGLPMSDTSRSRYAIWMIEDAKERGEKLYVKDAARLAGVSTTAVFRQLKRDADKSKKMVDEFLSEESDVTEASVFNATSDTKKATDDLDSAVKRLIATIGKIVDLADEPSALSQYINERVIDEKMGDMNIMAEALRMLVSLRLEKSA